MKMKNWMRSAGFTLVELIVVIAILGILGAGAAVGYSGYVKKANEVADQQLLYDANIALAAACIENGTDITQVGDADLSTTAVVSNVKIGDTVNDDIAASYTKYMGTTGSFKAITPIFSSISHRFVAVNIKSSDQDLSKIRNSAFIKAEGLGVEGLMDKVANIAAMAGAFGDAFDNLYGSAEFLAFAANTLGISLTDDELRDPDVIGEKIVEELDKRGLEDTVLGNIAVLYAAKNTTSMTKDDINSIFSDPSKIKDSIKKKFDTDPAGALSEASLVYGLYTTYTYNRSDMTPEQKANATNSPSTVMNALNDPAFKAYVSSQQGQTDLDGYLASLNIINGSMDNQDAVDRVLRNGYNDPQLVQLFKNLLGN